MNKLVVASVLNVRGLEEKSYCSITAITTDFTRNAARPRPKPVKRMIVPNLPALDCFAKS